MTTKKTAAKAIKTPPLDPNKIYEVSESLLTLDEVEEMRATSRELSGGDPKVAEDVSVRVMVWILEKRDNPERTLKEMGAVTMSQIEVLSKSDPKD